MRRVVGRLVGLVVAVVVLLGAAAAAASAHATLESTTPGDGTVVTTAPTTVSATFDEAVGVSDDSLRVYDPAGHRVDAGATHTGSSPDQVVVGLHGGLADGTYTVAWHVVSADSHPVSGAWTFSIGHASAHVAASSVETHGSRGLSVGYGVVRALAYLAYALLAGGLLVVAWLWPAGLGVPRTRRLLGVAGAALLVLTLTALPLQSAYTDESFGSVLASRIGTALLVRAGLLVVLAIVLATRPQARPVRVTAVLAALGLALTWPIADHASTGRQVPLALAADTAHLVAMATWVGGLAVLLLVLLRSPTSVDDAGPVVARFSPVAGWCVLVLVVTGTYQAWRDVGHWAALVHTRYGVELDVKVAAVLVVIGLGALSRRHVRRGHDADGVDLRALRRSVGLEAVVVLVVLGLTAGLVETATARESYHPTVHTSGAFDTGARTGEVTVDVAPASPGPQTIRVSLTSRGTPYDPAQVTASLTLAAQDLGPLTVPLHRTSTGHYVSAAVPVDVRGDWTLDVLVRSDAFDETTVALDVPVT